MPTLKGTESTSQLCFNQNGSGACMAVPWLLHIEILGFTHTLQPHGVQKNAIYSVQYSQNMELCPCSLWSEDILTAMAGFLLMKNRCLSLGLNSMSAPAQKQGKLTLVCKCRCSLLDRLPVSRQHNDPFCLEVLLC